MGECTRCYWETSRSHWGQAVRGVVFVGLDKDGGRLYVGRAPHQGDLLPAKVAPTHNGAFVAYGGKEHSKFEYELLVVERGVADWQSASHGDVPARAFPVGLTKEGEVVYVARVQHDGTITPGKLVPSQGTCNISYAGVEIPFNEYEVLII